MKTTYRDAGVDIDAGDKFVENIKSLVEGTRRPEVCGSLGGFSGLFSLASKKLNEPILVSATDGVGTKLKIAIIADKHDSVGIDLVAMCVNDIVVCGAEPLFFLDYFATGHLEPEKGRDIVKGIAEGCKQAGCALLGGETAEMPGFYKPGDYDLAGFGVGLVDRENLLGEHRVKEGDLVLGLASTGLHSNGYSLVRRVLVETDDADLDSIPAGLSVPLKEELLRPTRIYVKVVLDLIKKADIHALAHITGGGLIGNLPRILPKDLSVEIDKGSWPILPIFQLVQTASGINDDEMLETFNLGIGMTVVIDKESLSLASQVASEHAIDCWPIGRVTKRVEGVDQFNLRTV